jgi:hypothetical protein
MQRDFHISYYFGLALNNLRDDLSHRAGNFLASGTGDTNASPVNLLGVDFGRRARLAYDLMQGFTGANFANACDIARAGNGRSHLHDIVANGADCLAASAIDAQVVSHGLVLSQRGFAFSHTRSLVDCRLRASRFAPGP